ncbi:Protein of unknown function [Lactobacillus acidophilus DSM 9126]|nr:Protein of unknown function [Lactobacillus acidophilus DSM 20079 = JCM 1132 = NBRC 13951 = CIP 76.13]CDF69363.1 Protein of unknown function [Lactobacillus acidophilus CIRM-BIA 442]CDF71118.1 Protein of unknown function [Lactobacillus acidophilus CIRM-BIA 445]CDF72948.1 Protein of unknown function [Lactobacillus acidophilus DSM 9126]CDF74937.1 Protein of unknown function [Lactobacillus acidophilus DSM 20242]
MENFNYLISKETK